MFTAHFVVAHSAGPNQNNNNNNTPSCDRIASPHSFGRCVMRRGGGGVKMGVDAGLNAVNLASDNLIYEHRPPYVLSHREASGRTNVIAGTATAREHMHTYR